MSKTQTQYRNDYLKDNEAQKNTQINALNQIYENQKKQSRETNEQEIAKAEASYDDLYRENAVRRLVNQRRVAEDMANLGLTNSGLNRAQQEGVQASFAYQQGELDEGRKETLDSLTAALSAAINEIGDNQKAALANVQDVYNQRADVYAQNMYAADTEAETRRQEAQARVKAAQASENAAKYNAMLQMQTLERQNAYIIKADGALLSRNFTGSLRDNGVSVYQDPNKYNNWIYIDENSGKRTSLPKDMNPYKGKVHENAQYGTFDNGYQPNNLGKTSNGKIRKLRALKKSNGETQKMTVNNNSQTIWGCDGTFYVWDTTAGKAGDYIQVITELDKKSGTVKWVVA